MVLHLMSMASNIEVRTCFPPEKKLRENQLSVSRAPGFVVAGFRNVEQIGLAAVRRVRDLHKTELGSWDRLV